MLDESLYTPRERDIERQAKAAVTAQFKAEIAERAGRLGDRLRNLIDNQTQALNQIPECSFDAARRSSVSGKITGLKWALDDLESWFPDAKPKQADKAA